MKIGIVTFHFASNYGAVLQCYALQEYLKKRSHNVEIINYRPLYHTVRYNSWKNPFLVAKENWRRNKDVKLTKRSYIYVRGFIRGIILSLKQTDKVKYNLFFKFTKDYLHQTRTYRSLEQLRRTPPEDEVYITGSDQLWNPDITDFEFDRTYFLDFGMPKIKRLSYAVSMKEQYTTEEMSQLVCLSRNLNSISIRESNKEFEDKVESEVTVCIDPTLLLNQEDFHPIEADKLVSESYVFIYGLENSEKLDNAVKIILQNKNLKIVNGSPHRTKLSGECICIYNYGPKEFLSYIKYADFVITNSFHGTAFSIIYQRPFVVIVHTTRSRRMRELLAKLDLSTRVWEDDRCKWEEEIDYLAVYDKLQELRDITKKYFDRNLI